MLQEVKEARQRFETRLVEVDSGRKEEYEYKLSEALAEMRAQNEEQIKIYKENMESTYATKVWTHTHTRTVSTYHFHYIPSYKGWLKTRLGENWCTAGPHLAVSGRAHVLHWSRRSDFVTLLRSVGKKWKNERLWMQEQNFPLISLNVWFERQPVIIFITQ